MTPSPSVRDKGLRLPFVVTDDENSPGGRIWLHDLSTVPFAQLNCLAVDAVNEIAKVTGETPRTIIEDLFKHAAADETWREVVG